MLLDTGARCFYSSPLPRPLKRARRGCFSDFGCFGSVLLPGKARVLIVDASRESREILRTLLDRQGTEIFETAHVWAAGAIADREQLDLIVCDADSDQSPTNEAVRELARQASRSAIPIVVLGTVRRDFRPLSGGNLVSKPYHYAPLLRKIEDLLGTRNNA